MNEFHWAAGYFQELQQKLISQQPLERQSVMSRCFEQLMEGIEANLVLKVRDRLSSRRSGRWRRLNGYHCCRRGGQRGGKRERWKEREVERERGGNRERMKERGGQGGEKREVERERRKERGEQRGGKGEVEMKERGGKREVERERGGKGEVERERWKEQLKSGQWYPSASRIHSCLLVLTLQGGWAGSDSVPLV
ncbi:unnamed protein product [Cyprideis torosa]|uniref:Uncharacterized protein n=1 Tax=Cyprideis torosa TaxID=163714 RepID=A0A7R8ZKE8_9CRUS|nr:unnamed protein product [Cyprideis torosa]CAG0884317.1 unnamed protein product [Cyprideis torosa]